MTNQEKYPKTADALAKFVSIPRTDRPRCFAAWLGDEAETELPDWARPGAFVRWTSPEGRTYDYCVKSINAGTIVVKPLFDQSCGDYHIKLSDLITHPGTFSEFTPKLPDWVKPGEMFVNGGITYIIDSVINVNDSPAMYAYIVNGGCGPVEFPLTRVLQFPEKFVHKTSR